MTWEHRLEHLLACGAAPEAQALSPLEERLLEFIAASPKTKFEIMDHLYGDRLNTEVRENRLKNLLNRLRKKRPELIVFENEKYRIADEVFLKQKERVG